MFQMSLERSRFHCIQITYPKHSLASSSSSSRYFCYLFIDTYLCLCSCRAPSSFLSLSIHSLCLFVSFFLCFFHSCSPNILKIVTVCLKESEREEIRKKSEENSSDCCILGRMNVLKMNPMLISRRTCWTIQFKNRY